MLILARSTSLLKGVSKVLASGMKRAQEYGVTGWCRNTKDEKVEGEAQASEEVLSKFFKDVDDGPRSARVTKVSQEERQIIEGESDFTVTR
ncbi:unnamed protein product [Fusarium langsethiae]|nr:unnamed protein product [Fusarium langsethiae]